jgi:sugar phosphate isomerase/epimerase
MTAFKLMATVLVGGAWLALAAEKADPKPAMSKGDGFEPGKKYADGAPDVEKLGWRLGMQSYTFRVVPFMDALDRVHALGLKYVEGYPNHMLGGGLKGNISNMDAETTRKVLDRCKELGISIVGVGVIGVPKDEADTKAFFQKWKDLGVENIVTETNLPFYDKLCDEMRMNVAFHNHPGSWPPEKILEASKGRSKRIGACADTGHWMRRGLVPTECIKQLQGRIICFHFKDLDEQKRDVPWGTGRGDVKKQLELLHSQGFKGVVSIEYESNLSMDALAQCVTYFNDCAKEIAAGN